MPYDYQLLDVRREGRLATVTINNPPINLITEPLYAELIQLSLELEADDSLTVVLMKSADPDFFLAHFDVEVLLSLPAEEYLQQDLPHSDFQLMCERFRTMDKITIAMIEGRVGGGGSELATGFDMRFGVRGRTVINQMEVPLGILPGGTGTQRLPRLVGRGRAMQIIMSGADLDADTAEHWGYLDRVLEADEIAPYVDALARRIASYPVESVRLGKQAVNTADQPLREGLMEEWYLFRRLMPTESARRNMRRFLEIGGQTRDGELRVGELTAQLGAST